MTSVQAYVGLISGTSMDGIDAVVADFSDAVPNLLAADTFDFPPDLRQQLDEVRADPDHFPTARLALLDAQFGDRLAEASANIIRQSGLQPNQIAAIGSHGQTVLHRPDANPPHTLQIGDPTRIVERTACNVVADFRRADLAAGGQGAPLAPLLHHALLADDKENRLVINLGGIANVTVLPAAGGRLSSPSGFDTGPANCFLDDWYRQHHVGQNHGRYDANGDWARSGSTDKNFLENLLKDDYLQRTPPKSTGIEYFSPAWLKARLPADAAQRPTDIQATLAEFSAVSLVQNIERFVPFRPDRMLLCGGGVYNADFRERLAHQLPGIPIESTAAYGIDPAFVEALLFAWLARERMQERVIQTPSITGSRHSTLLGALYSCLR